MKPARTEQRNPRSRGLDRKSTLEILRALNREDARVALAVRRELPKIARAVDAIVKALRSGGRLFYVGAGTSGRLAVLDAAECPPTFGTSPKMVQAIIAGGARALRHASEGAEDSAAGGGRDLRRAGLTSKDVVVGIAASGTTPYVLAALAFAKRRGAVTVGVTANPRSPLARQAGISIAPDTGPEAISGSTRLKAGTAQKLVLNLLSTAAMVRLGRVYENWMVHVALTNQKLRRRGVRILEEAAGVSASTAEHAVRQAGNDLAAALVMLKANVSAPEARKRLVATGGNVRKALEGAGGRRRTRA
ncbi:MAG TPA: N-acetylmuramic acid 6-phosphate etherase [Candidatus Baltobacteraceae bacterium]|nr:N-acetylmuramic acid 6-phosphate etherase [Candidatus Baltobacteraceae bacterium]